MDDAPRVKCRVFEDNAGALQLAIEPKLRPRTKHLAVQLHHFRHYVTTKQIQDRTCHDDQPNRGHIYQTLTKRCLPISTEGSSWVGKDLRGSVDPWSSVSHARRLTRTRITEVTPAECPMTNVPYICISTMLRGLSIGALIAEKAKENR